MSTDRTPTNHRLWYKDAVIYQLHVRTFFDSDGDGTGDFKGLISKLDYILALGVNTLWIMPFFQSPGDDDGYDVTDFEAVDARYGKLNDFKAFIAAAHERGLRVLVELVLNHTSDDHPWFQRARRAAPGSEERDFYVWSTDDRKYSHARVIFKDSEKFQLDLGSDRKFTLLAPLLRASTRSQLQQSARRPIDHRCDALLAGPRSRWLSAGRGPLSDGTG